VILLLNGSFGVGKSTVARMLRSAFAGSVVYDPEWAGSVLMRLPKWMKLRGSGTDDFQDIDLWRRWAVRGTKLFGRFAAGPVIVPMTFSRRDYFDEVVSGLRQVDPAVRVFCLQASLSTIHRRLAERGSGGEWLMRRVTECTDAHRDEHFGEPVDTEGRSAREVADDIVRRLVPAGTGSMNKWPRAKVPSPSRSRTP
jgi:broad-specificity NMP kinase